MSVTLKELLIIGVPQRLGCGDACERWARFRLLQPSKRGRSASGLTTSLERVSGAKGRADKEVRSTVAARECWSADHELGA